jgi:predicted dehydrogenase
LYYNARHVSAVPPDRDGEKFFPARPGEAPFFNRRKSMAKKIGVGIIGAGGIAQGGHIPNYQKLPGVEVLALCDPNEQKAREAAEKFGIPGVYADYRLLLDDRRIKVVSVCSPNYLHREHSIAALKAGKHVLCEKPVALNGAEAEEILRAATAAKRKFMVAFMQRFSAGSAFLKKIIADGEFGEIYYARASYLRRRGIPGLGGWFTTRRMSGGGPLIDCGVHILDKTCWLMGSPRPVAVSGVTFQKFKEVAVDGGWPPATSRTGDKFTGTFDVEDLASALIRFDNGAALVLESSWAGNSVAGISFNLFGTRAGSFEDSAGLKIFGDKNGVLTETTPTLKPVSGFEAEIAHFVECVREDRPVMTTPAEITAVARIIEGVYRSAESGRECRLD